MPFPPPSLTTRSYSVIDATMARIRATLEFGSGLRWNDVGYVCDRLHPSTSEAEHGVPLTFECLAVYFVIVGHEVADPI